MFTDHYGHIFSFYIIIKKILFQLLVHIINNINVCKSFKKFRI